MKNEDNVNQEVTSRGSSEAKFSLNLKMKPKTKKTRTAPFCLALLMAVAAVAPAVAQSVNVTSTGVGIGTASPQGALSVSVNNEDLLSVYSPATNRVALQTILDNKILATYGTYGGDAENRLLLQPLVGNVAIGTANPQGKFSISFNNNDMLSFYSGAENRIEIQTLLDNQALATYGTYGGQTENRLILQPLVGNVGIGTYSVAYKLNVNGTVRAKGFLNDTSNWADYVFATDYRLPPLSEVESHIKEKQHLPGIPSEKEVKENGVELGDMQMRLLAQIEQLTLHAIAQEKRLQAQEKRIAELEATRTAK